MLTRDHPSVQRNPMIADVFYRTGLIERWGRGTNRVAEMCRAAGIEPPTFQEIGPAALVTFRVRVGSTAGLEAEVESAPSRHQVEILAKCVEHLPLVALLAVAGRSDRTKFRNQVLGPMLAHGLLEMTIPDKPRSRLQRYRTTEAGQKAIAAAKPGLKR